MLRQMTLEVAVLERGSQKIGEPGKDKKKLAKIIGDGKKSIFSSRFFPSFAMPFFWFSRFSEPKASTSSATNDAAQKLLERIETQEDEKKNDGLQTLEQSPRAQHDLEGIIGPHMRETRESLDQLLQRLKTIVIDILDKLEKVSYNLSSEKFSRLKNLFLK